MSNDFRMTYLDWTALALVAVGALNWGLVGIAHFLAPGANWNVVSLLLGSIPELEFGVYLVVGLASLWTVYLGWRLTGVRTGGIAPEMEAGESEMEAERGTPK
ncbi:MAG: DUF378 domain-containing protein [Halorientalis sp.]